MFRFLREGWEISAFCLQPHFAPNFWNNLHFYSKLSLKNRNMLEFLHPRLHISQTVPRLLRWKHLKPYSLAIFQIPWCFPIPQGFLGMNDLAGLGNQIFKGTQMNHINTEKWVMYPHVFMMSTLGNGPVGVPQGRLIQILESLLHLWNWEVPGRIRYCGD